MSQKGKEGNPLAYFLTFLCYGNRLHGDDQGSVDRQHNTYDTPFLPQDVKRRETEEQLMKQDPYALDSPRRRILLDEIREVCGYRDWILHAVHIRRTHLHVVVSGAAEPERMLNDMKRYGSRALNRNGFDHANRKRWAYHGSTIHLWGTDNVQNAIRYTLYEQGDQMEVHLHDDLQSLDFKKYDDGTNRELKRYFDRLEQE